MRNAVIAGFVLILVVATAHAAPRPVAPEWDIIPSGVLDALCSRLQMDAIATGSVAIVQVTQPLITPATITALAGPKPKRRKSNVVSLTNRSIPISLASETCSWRAIDASDIATLHDEMIVELSAPLANPYSRGEAGMFARVTLGGEHPAWYWISLVPSGDGWVVRFVFVLSR